MTRREEFECWAESNCYILGLDEYGDYENNLTFSAFDGYKAAKTQAVPEGWKLVPVSERLPEVGCKVDTFIGERMIIGADLNLKHVAVQYHDGYMDILHISKIKPIETKEDRAKREEDEFVFLVESEYNKTPNEISFKAGIRAAYRKLKGGE